MSKAKSTAIIPSNSGNSKKKKHFWLSFDLGLKGDYKGLYEWLDKYDSQECGNNLAYVKFVSEENLDDPDSFKKILTEELFEAVQFSSKDRIYIIFGGEQGPKGNFVVGKRKRSDWEGYFSGSVGEASIDNG